MFGIPLLFSMKSRHAKYLPLNHCYVMLMSTIAIKENGTGEEEGRIDNKRKLGTNVRWHRGS